MGIININQVDHMSVDAMQKAHEKEIELVNEIDELAVLCSTGDSELTELEAKLDEYVEQVKEHFSIEEDLMEKYEFSSYDLHKLAHDMFYADLMYARRQWKDFGDISNIVSFVRKSPEWIHMHVTSADEPTAEYISKKMELVK